MSYCRELIVRLISHLVLPFSQRFISEFQGNFLFMFPLLSMCITFIIQFPSVPLVFQQSQYANEALWPCSFSSFLIRISNISNNSLSPLTDLTLAVQDSTFQFFFLLLHFFSFICNYTTDMLILWTPAYPGD